MEAMDRSSQGKRALRLPKTGQQEKERKLSSFSIYFTTLAKKYLFYHSFHFTTFKLNSLLVLEFSESSTLVYELPMAIHIFIRND